jgi:hypothetical protein
VISSSSRVGARPSWPNTPWRANVFRFMRVACHGACFATRRQSLAPSGSAVSISIGTSGSSSDSPVLNAS